MAPGPDGQLLTVAELAAFLRCSRVAIYRSVEVAALPFYKIPKVGLRFDPAEIKVWLEAQHGGRK